MPDRAQNLAQIEKLVSSHTLHGSESLCKLLRHLAKHSIEHPGVPIKEYQIATEVFGRQADFDPQLDSMVRVQAGRLRTKLAEYYASEGEEDTVAVELPKGTYVLAFHGRTPAIPRNHGSETHHDVRRESAPAEQSDGKWRIAAGVLAVALVTALVVIAVLFATRKAPTAVEADAVTVPPALHTFWKGFLTGPEEPWVIFSNARFVGRPGLGMRYYDSARDTKAVTLDHYTGVGEVLAVHNLDNVFATLHRQLHVKRGSLFSLDDAKNNDLIFIGSPAENLTLLEIPGTQEFVFKRVTSGPRNADTELINVHPQPGEAKEYLATASDLPMTEDYAVVAMIRGLSPTRNVLILAGTTTIGTQAAVEFVSRADSLERLLLRLSVAQSGELKPFEAVIRVKVARGVPVETELVAIRQLKS